MHAQTDQRLVLDLLENGKIDTSEADWLLERIGKPAAYRPPTPYSPDGDKKVILEINADEENLPFVIQKLSEALCNHQTPDQKDSIFKRFTRWSKPKAAAG